MARNFLTKSKVNCNFADVKWTIFDQCAPKGVQIERHGPESLPKVELLIGQPWEGLLKAKLSKKQPLKASSLDLSQIPDEMNKSGITRHQHFEFMALPQSDCRQGSHTSKYEGEVRYVNRRSADQAPKPEGCDVRTAT